MATRRINGFPKTFDASICLRAFSRRRRAIRDLDRVLLCLDLSFRDRRPIRPSEGKRQRSKRRARASSSSSFTNFGLNYFIRTKTVVVVFKNIRVVVLVKPPPKRHAKSRRELVVVVVVVLTTAKYTSSSSSSSSSSFHNRGKTERDAPQSASKRIENVDVNSALVFVL